MAQSGICHGHHRLIEQFCRLLLSSMDRLRSNDVALTQDTIANLLGVRRESITAAAGKLQAAGLIQYRRGRITVLTGRRWTRGFASATRSVKAELDRLFRAAPTLFMRAPLRRHARNPTKPAWRPPTPLPAISVRMPRAPDRRTSHLTAPS